MKRTLLLLTLVACSSKSPEVEKPTPVGTDEEPNEAAAPVESGNEIVDAHNALRAKQCAEPLEWSDKVAKSAQAWADELAANGCAFEHSDSPNGENLAAGTAGAFPAESVVQMWYDEVEGYDFKRGGFSMDTGHFTQLVWKDTKRVGCGMVSCNGLDVWVCQYDPPGNVEGEYRDQVGCK